MRKLITRTIMICILCWPSMSLAIDFTNGGWNTSFDYPSACIHSGVGGLDCTTVANDGVQWGYRTGKNVDGMYSQVSADANNPNGDGGLGARFWIDDGDDVYSGEARVHFPDQEPEIWIRWYVRYQEGFAWSAGNPLYDKWLYCRFGPDNTIAGSTMQLIPESSGSGGRIAIYIQSGGEQYQLLHPSLTWQDVFGTTSDGLWHMVEMYVKMDTDGSDGVGRMWIDGQLIINETDVDFSGGDPVTRAGMKWFEFQANQNWPNNGRPMYVDYDDMAVYKTTPPNTDPNGYPWIGPLNGFSGAGSAPEASSASLAQLPELVPAATLSSNPTTARFFGGASVDDGQTFANSFGFDTPIDIDVEIQPEAGHVNTVGNLYVAIVWEGNIFLRDENGAYILWDLEIENLVAAFTAKTLQSSEVINILDDVPLGPAGVGGTSFDLYVAYGTVAAPTDLFISGAPLTVVIQAEQ